VSAVSELNMKVTLLLNSEMFVVLEEVSNGTS
jgi:hypothetical protein